MMEKTWKPIVAGILDIIIGAGGLIMIGLIVIGILVANIFAGGVLGIFIIEAITSLVGVVAVSLIAILFLPLNALILVGGIYALQRKHWGWALAGSIAAFFVSNVLGVAAIIFIALSKDEFE